MATGFAVELSDLRGWSQQVDRAGADCSGISSYLSSQVTDGDFGAILELITMDYEGLIPKFTQALTEDGTRLVATSGALESTAGDFAETDAKVAQTYGVGKAITDDGLAASGFYDVAAVRPLGAPSCNVGELPKVTFGWVLDKVCELSNWMFGYDPREQVTRWIAGDIEKAALQASAWDMVGAGLDDVRANLASGSTAIGATWTGDAAKKSSAYLEKWLTSLGEQAGAARQVAQHLRDMMQGAVNLATNVCDVIRMIISICSAALASSYIPLWGQWKAAKTIKEAIDLFRTARKAIMAFWQILTTFKNLIITFVQALGAESLPPAPVGP